jgi:hypothetical protein
VVIPDLARLGSALIRGHPALPGYNAIAVLYGDSKPAARALETAAGMAAELHAGLNVLLAVAGEEDSAALRQKVVSQLGEQAGMAQFIPMPDASLPSLVEALADTGSAALILQRDHELLRTPSLRQCLNSLNCPLLVVR